MKITFEFDPYEDRVQLAMYQNVKQMHYALNAIYDIARKELKYSEEEPTENIEKILTEIKEKASIVYDID